MFGLDGATFTVLDPLMAAGVMPNLRRVCEGGTRATLGSTPWPITPQAWTTLATGRSAGHHGFTDFIRLQFSQQGPLLRFNTSIDNHCEALWHYASRCGKRATVLNYIGLAPPQKVNGHTMPGFVPGRHIKRASYPPDLFQRLSAVEGLDANILGLDMAAERQGLKEMPADQWIPWIDHHLTRERAWFAVLEHLMRHEPSDLTMIVFDGVDKLQHLAWRYLDPALVPARPTAWEREVIARCHAYFAQVDAFLGRTLELVGRWGRIFIASDHGFTATTEVVYINRWLCEHGYLQWKKPVAEDEEQTYVVNQLTRHLDLYDWQRTTAFALTPSSNGVYVTNVAAADYEAFRDKLIDGLMTIRGADGGQIVTQAMKREEWFAGPYMSHAPDITLRLRDHGFFSVLNARDTVIPRPQPAGTHHPDGVLLGIGPGMREGSALDSPLNILDVAPLLAHSVGLEIPAEYEGRFASEFYETDYLASDPPRVASAVGWDESASPTNLAPAHTHPPAASNGHAPAQLDDADEQILVERLRSLGYIE
jgi:predicted AlkP superfamily phosphohydrolase/phosphomutase